MKSPDEILKLSIDNQEIKFYQFNSPSPNKGIKANLLGSVGRIIECNLQPSDLNLISPKKIPLNNFGFGAGAKPNKEPLSAIGEAFGMNKRFFLAHPSKVGPNDPFISVKTNIYSPFFFHADLDFGSIIPRFINTDDGINLEGEVRSGTIFKFETSKAAQMASLLEKLIPNGLSVIYFRGKTNANDVVDKLLRKSPIKEYKKQYGSITSPKGLKDFFVMQTIPKGFNGSVEIIAIGVAFRIQPGLDSHEGVTISNEIFKRLFYFTPGTVKSSVWNSHIHGLILGYEDSALISPQDSIDLNQIPLGEIDSEKSSNIPRSGRVVHLENTTKILSGAFKIIPISDIELH
jgi:hypothetical protein